MTVGVSVEAVETPASTNTNWSTQNAFAPVLSDWGAVGQPIAAASLAGAASQLGTPSGATSVYGPRTATSAAAIDAADTITNEDGTANPTIYYSRVVGPSPVKASLVVQDATPATSFTVTAAYVGVGGNGIYLQVMNNTTSFDLSLFDSAGNTLVAATGFGTVAAGVAWLNQTGIVTATAGAGTLPVTLTATALTGGTDDRGSITISNVTTALSYLPASLGPGQIIAPNWTNSTLSGIWSAAAADGLAKNRVALCDMDDGSTATEAVTAIGDFGTSAVASYAGFWAGNRYIPGIVGGTSRSVPPSSVIAGLCARVDQAGNPNIAAAGVGNALAYATQPATIVTGAPNDTYSDADLQTLNAASINTFQRVNGIPTNYGFVAAVPPTADQIYWQFSHSRLRMFIVAQAQLLGQPYVFAQLDGAGSTQAAFKTALDGLLMAPLAQAGALYLDGALPLGYTIDTGPDINPPSSIAQGILNTVIACSFSYFAQNIKIVVNVQPITAAAA